MSSFGPRSPAPPRPSRRSRALLLALLLCHSVPMATGFARAQEAIAPSAHATPAGASATEAAAAPVLPMPAAPATPAPFAPAPVAMSPTPASAATGEPAKPSGLPHDLSPLGMFLAADAIVKAVMIGLALASVAAWTVWLAKLVEIGAGRRRLRRELAGLSGERSLAACRRSDTAACVMSRLVDAAALELRLSSDATVRDGLRDRISSRLADIEADAVRRARLGTGLLASIGATAPFIGLFGTVWGIMNSFIGISKAQTTNLAVVAPGIAEALLATALGLVAAIPAVLFYNHLARAIAVHKGLLREAAAEVERLVSRDLDRSSHLAAPHLRPAYAAK